MKTAIIGAGAAGIMAAITAKRLNPKHTIELFDINNAIGKKILASGNGRCNISNTQVSVGNFIGENPSFVEPALKAFDYKAFEKFCQSIGLMLEIKESNKVYPLSNEAKSVVNLLENELNCLGVKVHLESKVIDVQKEQNSFTLTTNNTSLKGYDHVLISSGLAAAPQLGASEDGLNIAQAFGHSFNMTYPSLVGLHTSFEHNARLQGVKKEASVSLFIDGQKECEITGDVLFTKYGLSGFAILDVSQYAVYPLSLYQDVQVSLNLFPKMNKNELLSVIQNLFKTLPESSVALVLSGLLSNKLAPVIASINGIDKETKAKEVNAKQIRGLVNTLINLRFKITDTQGFKHAEASGGGVRVDEVESKTYESKKCKGLYFAGEVMDIVGHRGGYNLQYAWASGYLAGKSIAGK